MYHSSSRRSPPGTRRPGGTSSTSNLDDTYGRVSTRPSGGGVVLESVQHFVNGKPVSTKTYNTQTLASASHTSARHHAPSRSQTIVTRQAEPSSTAIARSSSTRHAEPSTRTSRTSDAFPSQPTVTTKRTVYAYPDRPARPAEPSSRHHTRRLSADPTPRDPYPPERSSRGHQESRAPPAQDAYSYMNARDMFTDTEPKWRETRRQGSVDDAGGRRRERPMSVVESFPPPQGRSTGRERDNPGPPPTTRGLNKINAGGGLVRAGSLRDPRRDDHHQRSPERSQRRQNSYSSDEEMFARPAKSATMPTRARNDDRDLYPPPRDAYEDTRARRPSPADRGVASRGFGVMPGSSDYNGYARDEAPGALREPPIRGFLEAPADAVDPRNYMPELPRDDRRGDVPTGRTSRNPAPRELELEYDLRDQDPRDKPRHRRDEHDYERNTRRQDYDSRYDQSRETNRAEERRPRDKRYERDEYDDDDYDSRRNRPRDEGRSHRDDLVAGAEAALGAGAVAYGANAIRAERDGDIRNSARSGKEKETRRETGTDGGRGRDQERREEEESPPHRPRETRSSPKAGAAIPDPDSPDQPRRRRYVAGGDDASDMGSLSGSPPAAAFDVEEDYRRRVQQASQQASPQQLPADAALPAETPRRTSREELPAGNPRRYIPDPPPATDLAEPPNTSTSRTNPIYTHPENDPSLAVPPDPDRATARVRIMEPNPPKSILRKPTEKFPEHPHAERPGVAPLDKTKGPPDATWTKISRDIVNPAALKEAGERFEERDDFVVVLRVLDKREIQVLADMTKVLRERRYEMRKGVKQIGYEEGKVRE